MMEMREMRARRKQPDVHERCPICGGQHSGMTCEQNYNWLAEKLGTTRQAVARALHDMTGPLYHRAYKAMEDRVYDLHVDSRIAHYTKEHVDEMAGEARMKRHARELAGGTPKAKAKAKARH